MTRFFKKKAVHCNGISMDMNTQKWQYFHDNFINTSFSSA